MTVYADLIVQNRALRRILADAETRWVDGPEAAILDDLRRQIYLLENHTPQCREVGR